MKRRNVRTLSLIVVTFTYLLIGAAIFDVLEGPTNEETYDGLVQVRKDFIAKYNMTEHDYKMLEIIIIEKQPHKAGPQWKFAGSFYYALVVLSLIGYGHSTPKTLLGTKVTCIFRCTFFFSQAFNFNLIFQQGQTQYFPQYKFNFQAKKKSSFSATKMGYKTIVDLR